MSTRIQTAALLLGAASLWMAAPSAHAQATAVEVAAWPEYDRPDVLVLLHVQLDAELALPAAISIPIPASVGQPHAVAYRGPDDKLLLADYSRREVGDVAWLDIQAPGPVLQIEYYAPLQSQGDARSFTWSWPAGTSVGHLSYEVLAPAGAVNMKIEPAPTEQFAGKHTEIFYHGDLGAIAVDQSAGFSLRYDKSATVLTKDVVDRVRAMSEEPTVASTEGLPPVGAAQPVDLDLQQPEPSTPWWFYVLGALVVGVAGWLLFRPMKRE